MMERAREHKRVVHEIICPVTNAPVKITEKDHPSVLVQPDIFRIVPQRFIER
jgi:hypothetical protein